MAPDAMTRGSDGRDGEARATVSRRSLPAGAAGLAGALALGGAQQPLEAQLAAVRQRVARARADVEQGERIAADLEGDLARCRERLALQEISPSSGRRGH